ncbi:M1 family metallopeptidase [Deinococcus knuensis]|uniref:Aminopeptidase N n=1 Tax=Deinococcus knuensis TaxID=1837380 RepID=A0ABQ2SF93_9DEIO|nr:M1 family metallopeptidase [Deinococcus knuensis]GGS20200.1 zinc metalloprotease [Deinococcus knuensis]
MRPAARPSSLRPCRLHRRVLAGLLLTGSLLSAAAQTTPEAAPATQARPVGDTLYPTLGQAGLDAVHYDVHLSVTQPGTRALSGDVTALLRATRDLPLISLDFLGPAVTVALWNGQPVPFQQDHTAGKLLVLRALPAGQEARVTLRYAGVAGVLPDPVFPFTLGWQAVPDPLNVGGGANFAFSEPDGARTFIPVNDHPSDPATFTVTLTVPPGTAAVASGQRVRVTDTPASPDRPAAHTVTFDQARPIPTYTLAVHIGPLEAVDRPPVNVGPGGAPIALRDYFPPGTPDTVRAPYRRTGEILTFLSGWFGPYPFRTYGSAVVTPRLPALETAGLSTMPVTSSSDRVLVHETAHQWFGNSVLLRDWSDVWLNESFATYAELLWQEHQGQNTQPLTDAWYATLQRRGTRPLVAATPAEMFDSTAYQRGALALHALRRQVGDDAFRTFLRGYAQGGAATPSAAPERAAQVVGTGDLLAYTRRTLGEQAERVLRDWVQSSALPPAP